MRYEEICHATFLLRKNRFVAEVSLDGKPETVHVKNTGRCRELLLPGCSVVLSKAHNSKRKTLYDLVAVHKAGLGWVNIDSQAPNHVVREWLTGPTSPFHAMENLKPEYTYGNSRIDFYFENASQKILMEVKGCTLEMDGVGYFPDAPTQRGEKHLRELAKAVKEGYDCYIAFVIAMPKVQRVLPNLETHPAFGEALEVAVQAGVKVLHLPCFVSPEEIHIL